LALLALEAGHKASNSNTRISRPPILVLALTVVRNAGTMAQTFRRVILYARILAVSDDSWSE
jgi:hypothetical protein